MIKKLGWLFKNMFMMLISERVYNRLSVTDREGDIITMFGRSYYVDYYNDIFKEVDYEDL